MCSEGSTIVVLEPLERAVARGARVHAEVIGHGNSNDAYHVAAPHPESRGLIQMMSRGLASAGIAARGGRLHQRARHVDAAGRRVRDVRDQDDLRRPRLRPRRVLDEVGDRPPVRRSRRVRDRDVRARVPRRRATADAELPRARPRVRPRLRGRGRAADRCQGRDVELDRARRPQRLRARPPLRRLSYA